MNFILRFVNLFLLLCFFTTCAFALCPENQPMCDINSQVPPIFLQDDWLSVGQSSPLTLNTQDRVTGIKKNTPYTISCMVSFKNFTDGSDQDQINILGWDGVDSSKITYTEGNNPESNSHLPIITIHYSDEHVYFKHVIITSDRADAGSIGPFRHDMSYDCV